jgi:hypothetical protein
MCFCSAGETTARTCGTHRVLSDEGLQLVERDQIRSVVQAYVAGRT